tara:strand:+ start:119 stop:355 length:237 start_codon:yes stop_codon:yes gene_type:complete
MGFKDWMFGGKEEDLPPITIQQFEQLLTKRRSRNGDAITLIVDDVHYAVIKRDDLERLLKLADAFDHLIKSYSSDEGR